MASSTGTGDQGLNRIALYSAIFAGVAYVGYSCAKDIFGRSDKSRKGKSKQNSGIIWPPPASLLIVCNPVYLSVK